MVDDDTLARRLSVEQAVATFEKAERDIRAGFELIAGAEKLLTDTFEGSTYGWMRCEGRYDRAPDFNRPEESLLKLRRQVWRSLVERLELRRFMSIAAWEKLQKDLDSPDVPEITQATVVQMATHFRSQLPEMLEQAVREVYDWLRPRGGTWLADYKTNSVVEVRRRVILGCCVERWASTWHVGTYADPKLSALENVFTALDGRGSVTKTHYSQIATMIREMKLGQPCVGETPYFRFRGHANGNLHLEFLRLDLLARFNAVAGGARLRPHEEVA